jgi:formylglycine-generating enzyme required for sulfatase activity
MRLLLLLFLFEGVFFTSYSQNKKEQIRFLTNKTDSLEKVIRSKNIQLSELQDLYQDFYQSHKDTLNILEHKIATLEVEISELKIKPKKGGVKHSKADKNELVATKKVLDSLMRSDEYFVTGKSSIIKKKGKPKVEVVDIQGGTFFMGSPETEKNRETDEVQHKVTLSDYKISKTEVTFDMYDAYCDSVGLQKPDDNGWGRGNRPVINITWREANNFAVWMGARLPSEAEWEYAARGKGKFAYGKSNCLNKTQANFDGSNPNMRCGEAVTLNQTMPVGSLEPNTFGIYDMFGNVYEWCSDWYGAYPLGTSVDPQGSASGGLRVNRGGSWANPASSCRASSRESSHIDFKGNRIGFRIAYSRE